MLPILLLAPPAGGAEGGSPFVTPIMFGLLFAIMYFLVIRPQQQQAKKQQAMIAAVKKGDRILTSGGIYARVIAVHEATVDVEVAKGVTVELQKAAIASVAGVETKD